MKILLAQKLTYIPALSGASKSDRFLFEGLAERGYHCRVVALASAARDRRGNKQFLTELAVRGIRLTSVSSAVNIFHYKGVEVHAVADSHQLCPYLIDQIRQLDPTWTLVSEDRTYLTLAAALEASPSRVVYLAHSQATLPFGPESFEVDATKTDLLRQVAGIITVSTYLKDYIQRWSGLESVALQWPVYGAGPFPRFGRFDNGFVTMVNPSRIKGIGIFLQLARRLPEVQFAAVPTWATRNADRAALEQMPNVRLLRPTEEIDEIFAHTRILLVPSLWGEAFGKIVVEAMLRGIPVLASNTGGLPEAKLGIDYLLPIRPIEHYEEHVDERLLPIPVIPDQDIGPWLEALQRLLSDRGHYDCVSAASRTAALTYVSNLGFTPVKQYLEGLAAVPRTEAHGHNTDESPECLDSLSPEKLELLAWLLRKHKEEVSEARLKKDISS